MFLEIRDLKKSYGEGDNRVDVLKGINFEVGKGEICVLLGPSGSGKSTLTMPTADMWQLMERKRQI